VGSAEKGVIFDIQYNALYDGAGIRTVVFLKGCPLRCDWCHNPESQLLDPQMTYFAEKCQACGTCVEACEQQALSMVGKIVVRDTAKCTACGACAEECPTGAMEIAGKEMSPGDIVEKAARDKIFYDNSGGGVTISGGEATMQPEFLVELLKQIRAREIHVALETCGFFRKELRDQLVQHVDTFLFDIKHADPEEHKKRTGVSTQLIQENFREILAAAGAERIVPRVPLIPGFNIGDDAIDGIIKFLTDSGHPGPVHLMPYNPFARTKWEKVGRGDEYRVLPELEEEKLEEIRDRFEKAGLEVVINR